MKGDEASGAHPNFFHFFWYTSSTLSIAPPVRLSLFVTRLSRGAHLNHHCGPCPHSNRPRTSMFPCSMFEGSVMRTGLMLMGNGKNTNIPFPIPSVTELSRFARKASFLVWKERNSYGAQLGYQRHPRYRVVA